MATTKYNKNGLGRYISSEVKRQVRQRDGFGCVRCGSGFYQYDHLGVEFVDADLHDPDKIVLLCGSCHDRKTRNNLSTETILDHAKSPKCNEEGFSRGGFDIGKYFPEIILGTLRVKSSKVLIKIDGENIFSIDQPEHEGEPYRVNAKFYDKAGRLTLEIVENETRASVTNWDVALEGPKVSIRSRLREFDLVIRSEPPHRLVIERLDMIYKGFSIQCREGRHTTIEHNGQVFETQSGEFCGCDSIITIENGGIGIGRNCESVLLGYSMVNPYDSLPRIPVPVPVPEIQQPPFATLASRQSRNSLCGCGSGKKYKRCHG